MTTTGPEGVAAGGPGTSPNPGVARPAGRAFTAADWMVFASIAGIWGASFLFIKIGLESLAPGLVTFLRVGLGAAALNLLPAVRTRFAPRDCRLVIAVSWLWVAVPSTLFPIAEQHLNSAVTGLLNGATPTFTALFGLRLFGRRTSGPQLVGVAVGFLGILLVSLPSCSPPGAKPDSGLSPTSWPASSWAGASRPRRGTRL